MPLNPITAQDPLGGFRHLAMVAGTRRPIPLAATRFTVRILGNLALVTAERSFRNVEAESIEATMTFPVPVQAALVGMSARIGERRIVATTQRKAAARETYEAAIDSGRTAVLHEEALRGVHMISVGHVPPGQEVAVLGTWAIPLAVAGDGALLVIPTTVGDVYGRSPLPDSDDLTHAPILLEADLEVSCDSGVASLVGGRLVEGKARVVLNAPIAIRVTGALAQVLGGVAADGRVVELTVKPEAEGATELDGVLLLDNSGSMAEPATGRDGDRAWSPTKHEVATHGLEGIAAELRPSDRLDIWEFNSKPRHLGLGVGGGAVGRLVSLLRPPTGGTELGEAVAAVLARREGADVLLVTDGKSHALDVHGLARRGARFTVVLVGEDSLAANVGHLAVLTGGQVFVSSGLDLAEVVRMAIAAMRDARLRQPKVAKGSSPVVAAARTGGMLVTARWGLAAGATAEAEVGRAIAAYAAWLALPLMEEAEAAALAEAEGVVCHLTSMVLVDEAGEARQGIPAQRKVPLMSPAGHFETQFSVMSDLAIPAVSRMPAMRTSARAAATLPPEPPACTAAPPRGVSDRGQRQLDIPTFLRRTGPAGPLPRAQKRSLSKASPPAPPLPVVPASSGLKACLGRVDWTGNLEALRRGVLRGNVPPDVLARLEAAARLGAVQDLAALLGVTAEAVVVALLARAEEMSSRGAARFARTVLGAADKAKLEAAAQAVGL